MYTKRRSLIRLTLLVAVASIITGASIRLQADSGTCGGQTIALPFTDVAGSIFFCNIAEAYFIGLTNGTDATHYSPSAPVPRDQMAAFITRTQDSALKRGSRRAALNMWAKPDFAAGGFTDVGGDPSGVESDGEDLWVANFSDDTVSRVRASDGRVIETWTGATGAAGVLVARGRIFVTGYTNPGALYRIDPKQSAGAVDIVSNNLGEDAVGITTDGDFIWTANSPALFSSSGSVSKVNPVTGNVTTFTAGITNPRGILYDGSSIWVTDSGEGKLQKLNSDGTVALSIRIAFGLGAPIFDGTNIWVPVANGSDLVTVVRVKDSGGNPLAAPFVLATLTGNGLAGPHTAAFDGQRILVTNFEGDSVSLWKAADLSPLGSVSAPAGSFPYGACSDGINFWITFSGTNKLARS
jgi:hypothetical protein